MHLAVDAAEVEVAGRHFGALLHDEPTLAHLGGALEQARVNVEHVTRVRLAARRAAQQQRHLAVGDGLLRQVVVDAERVMAAVAEVLAMVTPVYGARYCSGRGLGRGRDDDDRVVHRAVLLSFSTTCATVEAF